MTSPLSTRREESRSSLPSGRAKSARKATGRSEIARSCQQALPKRLARDDAGVASGTELAMEEDRAAQPLDAHSFRRLHRIQPRNAVGGASYALKVWLAHNHWRRSRTSTSKYELRCNLARTAGAWLASVSGLVR